MDQPTDSKHLKILEEAGLITYSRDGLWDGHRLADGVRNPNIARLLGNLRYWLEAEALVARLPEIRCEIICSG